MIMCAIHHAVSEALRHTSAYMYLESIGSEEECCVSCIAKRDRKKTMSAWQRHGIVLHVFQ